MTAFGNDPFGAWIHSLGQGGLGAGVAPGTNPTGPTNLPAMIAAAGHPGALPMQGAAPNTPGAISSPTGLPFDPNMTAGPTPAAPGATGGPQPTGAPPPDQQKSGGIGGNRMVDTIAGGALGGATGNPVPALTGLAGMLKGGAAGTFAKMNPYIMGLSLLTQADQNKGPAVTFGGGGGGGGFSA